MDEALRVGGSGFLGKSDAGDEDDGSVLDEITFWTWDLHWHLIKNDEFNLGSNLMVVGNNHISAC